MFAIAVADLSIEFDKPMNRDEKVPPTIPQQAERKQEAERNEDDVTIESTNEPPKVYIASCGTLCDVFWWARRRPD